jgi:hypothetical protein
MLDIRTPIGLMFVLVGLLLVTYGLISERALYLRSLGLNVNLWWGLAVLAFGAIMLYLGRRPLPPRKTTL